MYLHSDIGSSYFNLKAIKGIFLKVFYDVFPPQGARGFPGAPGLPGLKGHRVSSVLCNPFRYCGLLSRVWGALPSKSLQFHLSVVLNAMVAVAI